VLLASVFVAGCIGPFAERGRSSPPNPGSGETAQPCPAALLEGVLLPDDAGGFLVRHEAGFVTPVIWPDGYTVRDGEVRELLDRSGQLVAREGDFVSLGGGMIDNDAAFAVCGEFTVRPDG